MPLGGERIAEADKRVALGAQAPDAPLTPEERGVLVELPAKLARTG